MIQVPQGREVFPSMTVLDNLEMGAATRKYGAENRRDIEDIYELFPRLGERRGALAGSLSGGEQQQVAECWRCRRPGQRSAYLKDGEIVFSGNAPKLIDDRSVCFHRTLGAHFAS